MSLVFSSFYFPYTVRSSQILILLLDWNSNSIHIFIGGFSNIFIHPSKNPSVRPIQLWGFVHLFQNFKTRLYKDNTQSISWQTFLFLLISIVWISISNSNFLSFALELLFHIQFTPWIQILLLKWIRAAFSIVPSQGVWLIHWPIITLNLRFLSDKQTRL